MPACGSGDPTPGREEQVRRRPDYGPLLPPLRAERPRRGIQRPWRCWCDGRSGANRRQSAGSPFNPAVRRNAPLPRDPVGRVGRQAGSGLACVPVPLLPEGRARAREHWNCGVLHLLAAVAVALPRGPRACRPRSGGRGAARRALARWRAGARRRSHSFRRGLTSTGSSPHAIAKDQPAPATMGFCCCSHGWDCARSSARGRSRCPAPTGR